MDRSWMKASVRGLTTYYNPDVGDALRIDTNVSVLGSNPAVDVLDHKVVQLVVGVCVPGSQQVVLPNVRDTVCMWVLRGAPYHHLVDLNAASGKEDNSDVFCNVIRECGVPCEIGSGIMTEEQVKRYIDADVDRVL